MVHGVSNIVSATAEQHLSKVASFCQASTPPHPPSDYAK